MGFFFGILLIVVGLTSFYPPLRDWFIKTGNTLNGTKTKITSGTIIWAQISGVIMILFGLGLLFSALSIQ